MEARRGPGRRLLRLRQAWVPNQWFSRVEDWSFHITDQTVTRRNGSTQMMVVLHFQRLAPSICASSTWLLVALGTSPASPRPRSMPGGESISCGRTVDSEV